MTLVVRTGIHVKTEHTNAGPIEQGSSHNCLFNTYKKISKYWHVDCLSVLSLYEYMCRVLSRCTERAGRRRDRAEGAAGAPQVQELQVVPREHLPGESDAAGVLLSWRGELSPCYWYRLRCWAFGDRVGIALGIVHGCLASYTTVLHRTRLACIVHVWLNTSMSLVI